MTGPEETFRRVLAARLPAGPGWTAWIDGTAAELAGSVPVRSIDRGAADEVVAAWYRDELGDDQLVDRILALQWPESS